MILLTVTFEGCSSDGDGDGGGACESSDDCITWECTCVDGLSLNLGACVFNQCKDEASACGDACGDHGGVSNSREKPTVKDSAECIAYCEKAASLGCRSDLRCSRSVFCGLDADECPDQKRAQLQCIIDTGTWSCNENGGWSVSSGGCPSADCPASDAGTD